ncbi:MAG: S46 family peptidase [Candidatus Aminicenantes bacterium]|nr:S46 family peptidase [Candidatus Aminicenantes bacterium]
MKRTRSASIFSVLTLLIGLIVPLRADEGMWLFNMPPKELIQKKHGFALTPEWISHIQLSSVRFGGASGSFVSPDGLVLTNHHVGQGAIQNLSTKEHDLMKTGFYARTQGEELKCPGMELWVLQDIEDVTAAVTGARRPGMSASEAAEARGKSIAAIEKEGAEKTGLKCQVVTLYSGGMYHLYRYKSYIDVRLVFAPEYLMAFFGGDPDNFTYPRYDLDVSIFRIYENGQPLKTPNYLKWAARGVKEGDLVFCSGNPGSTGRLLTSAQLEFLRDVSYPFAMANFKRRQALMHEYSKMGPEEARVALRNLFGIENSLKAITGYQSGLLDMKLMEKKAREEQALREAVRRNADLEKEYGKAWDELAAAQKTYAFFFKEYTFFERANGFYTTYFNTARTIVRLAMEKSKPNDQRLREFRDSNLPSLERGLFSPSPISDEFETLKLADSLAQLKEELGTTQEVRWLLGDRDPAEVAKELVSGTRLKDLDLRKKLTEGGLDAVYRSVDPMIKLALLVDPKSRGLRVRFEKEVEAVETTYGALIAKAIFLLKGTSIPPDATSTLRLSFGVVKGYVENEKKVPYQTTLAGLYERSKKAGNKPPYELPPGFVEKKGVLNLATPINYVATCDSIGGNSGSPVVNRKAEFTGVLFDGNIQSLPTRFVYEEEISRSVMVHASAIIEALIKVYGAKPLVDEIMGKL